MSEPEGTINLANKNKVGLKLLGGGVPNVAYQFGVCDVLTDWGFEIPTGCLDPGEQRQYGPTILNPLIGSSSGSFAAICLSMGYGFDDLLGDTGRIEPISEEIIKDPLESGPWALLKRLYHSRQQYTRLKKRVKSNPSVYEHIVNTYYPIWTMSAMQSYLRDEILEGCDFGTLRAEMYVLAVMLEQRKTLILGGRSEPQKDEDDFKFQDGIKPWNAAAGSMSLPPYYEPFEWEDPPEEISPARDESVVLIDGEIRDPFSTDAAEDSGVDLVIVSSFYRVHEYSPELGHIHDYGTVPVMFQERAQARDANKADSIRNRHRRKSALEEYRRELESHYEDPETIESKMSRMEEILDYREGTDVIEIQAQNYFNEELNYPYWDPFSLNREVLEFQYEAGQTVARETLRDCLVKID